MVLLLEVVGAVSLRWDGPAHETWRGATASGLRGSRDHLKAVPTMMAGALAPDPLGGGRGGRHGLQNDPQPTPAPGFLSGKSGQPSPPSLQGAL